MLSKPAMILLQCAYVYLTLANCIEGSWAKATYWLGALVLNIGVYFMK